MVKVGDYINLPKESVPNDFQGEVCAKFAWKSNSKIYYWVSAPLNIRSKYAVCCNKTDQFLNSFPSFCIYFQYHHQIDLIMKQFKLLVLNEDFSLFKIA